MPLSGKEMCKLFLKAGYRIVPKQGKGSHCKLEKEGNVSIVPMHKELKKGTERKLLKELKS
ncbi:MAG: type II toxin-antitoxin system HicA family toxin [Deltaproteobacteria bacterium]|nr:type II toxin-antitoxin system HicA family toxin [Deltaproteobacteria bacterium]